MQTPTFRQRLIASNWPPTLLSLLLTLGIVAQVVCSLELNRQTWKDPWLLVLLVFIVIATLFLGFIGAVFIVSLFYVPLASYQGRKNGAPFEIGEEVIILSGSRLGDVVTVREFDGGDSYRVQLGKEARETRRDYFSSWELLRVERG